jgi:hypothetical protein
MFIYTTFSVISSIIAGAQQPEQSIDGVIQTQAGLNLMVEAGDYLAFN